MYALIFEAAALLAAFIRPHLFIEKTYRRAMLMGLYLLVATLQRQRLWLYHSQNLGA